MMGIIGVRLIWGRVKSFLGHRPHGYAQTRQDRTELNKIHDQPSVFSFSLNGISHLSVFKTSPVDEEVTLLERGAAERTEDGRISRSQKCGWINGVFLCAKGSTLVVLLNLIFIAIAAGLASRYPDNDEFKASVIYRGSCTLTKRWDIALHLIINILSTGILAASNYCMQTLVAPSREEIDVFHARGRWLDIGEASLKNLCAIGRYRLALWVVLLITTTPFHLLYNSMIFQSFSPNQYGIVVGPNNLDSQNVWDLSTPQLEKCFMSPLFNGTVALGWHEFASNIASGNYERLTTQQCIDFHTGSSHTGTKALVALADNLTVSDGGNASMLLADVSGHDGIIRATSFAKQSYGAQGDFTTCVDDLPWPAFVSYEIQGCLAVKAEEHCQLLYCPPICLIVVVTASAKVIAMFLAARIGRSRSAPLLTVGDAVASFIAKPDPTTEGMCWISYADIRHKQWKTPCRTQGLADTSAGGSNQHKAITYKRLLPRKFWIKAPSVTRWLATLILWLTCIGTGVFLFTNPSSPWSGYLFSASRLQQLWSSGGDGDNYGAVEETQKWPMLGSIVVANAPQLVITISYYCYNSVLTSMLAAAEYSSYGVNRKSLRVTWPVKGSQQRSTYWISVPYKYGIPILVIYMALHWLVSQSIFYVSATPYNVRGQPVVESETSSLGFSPLPMFLSVLVVGVMVCILVGLAFQRFKSVMPLAGGCSAAISAACHPPRNDSLDTAALGMLMWGETIAPPAWVVNHFEEIEDQRGHCGFTSLDTLRPSLTKYYA